MRVESRKMTLIPIDRLEQLKAKNLTPLTNPNKDQVVKSMSEMSTLLDDKNLQESLKASRFSEKVKNFYICAAKLLDPATTTTTGTTSIPPNNDEVGGEYPHVIQ